MAKREPRVGEGRPTKYNEAILELSNNYLKTYTSLIPSKQGLALALNVTDVTVDNWARDHEEFFCITEKIRMNQHEKLVNGGLGGDFNAAISKLILGKHGYSDKAETQTNISFENLTDDELKAKIQSLLQ